VVAEGGVSVVGQPRARRTSVVEMVEDGAVAAADE